MSKWKSKSKKSANQIPGFKLTWKLAVANEVAVVKKKNRQNPNLIEKRAQTVPSAIKMPSFKLKLVNETKADEAINHVWIKRNQQNSSKHLEKQSTVKTEGGLNDFLGCNIIMNNTKEKRWLLQPHLT